jgi:hypothetical protein
LILNDQTVDLWSDVDCLQHKEPGGQVPRGRFVVSTMMPKRPLVSCGYAVLADRHNISVVIPLLS